MEAISVTALDVVTSTSDHLAEAAENGAPEGTAFRANVQTKGRGRRGRDWVSPRGNLYVSILLRPTRIKSEWPSLSLVSGLALYEALMRFRKKDDLGLKWPNDMLYQQQKCAGLLLEARDDALLLGCGVNLNEAPETVPGWPPISLNSGNEAKPQITPEALMDAFSETLVIRYNQWQGEGFDALRLDWRDAAAHIGQKLSIARANDTIEGIFTDVDHQGNLCLTDGAGVFHTIAQGDVVRAGVKNVTGN